MSRACARLVVVGLCFATVLMAGCTPPAPVSPEPVLAISLGATGSCSSGSTPGVTGAGLCQYDNWEHAQFEIYPVEVGGLEGCPTYGVIPITAVLGSVSHNGVVTPLGSPGSLARGIWHYDLPVSATDGPIKVTVTLLTVGIAAVCVEP